MYGRVQSNLRYSVLLIRGTYYIGWLLKEIFVSSIGVALAMWKRDPQISPSFDWVPLEQKNDIANTVYANSITLTPGTVAVIVGTDAILVHGLRKSGIADLKKNVMQSHILKAIMLRKKKSR